jgi:hypothetical protein
MQPQGTKQIRSPTICGYQEFDRFRRCVAPTLGTPNVIRFHCAVLLDGEYDVDNHPILDDLQAYANLAHSPTATSRQLSKMRHDLLGSINNPQLKKSALEIMDQIDLSTCGREPSTIKPKVKPCEQDYFG